MFMPWLMEQEDREDDIGALYHMIYKDYNNGCLGSIRTIKGVLEHFLNRHPNQFIIVREYFITALKAYEDPLAK